MCGDVGIPKQCLKGAITASGEPFDPDIASAAIPLPHDIRMWSTKVFIQVKNGPCIAVKVNDKSNPRWIGKRGFDLSPRAVELLTGKRTKHFKQKVYICKGG